MGTCVSKCCSNPSPPFDSVPPQDKLVISQFLSTPTNPLSIDLSKMQTVPSSSSSSYSSSSSSLSSLSSSCHSNSSDSTYSRSSLKDGSLTNDFLLSCARENPYIIVQDPHKHSVPKHKPNKYPVKTSPPPSKLVQRPRKQPIAGANQSLPSKRGCSSSPSTLANQKSFKTELSSAIPSPSRKLSSPSTHWRSTNATSAKIQRHEVGVSGDAVPLQLAARKEKLLPSSPYNVSGRQASYCQVGENGRREVFSEHNSRIALMEDLNNPLISMDCFIFL